MNNELELKITASLEQANAKLDKLVNTLNKGSKASDNFSNSATKIGKAFNWASAWIFAKKFFKEFDNGIDSINAYLETLNMFQLVMGDLSTQAENFQNTMSKAFGNDTQKQLEYQSYFQTLTESMGLQEKYAYIISENMTKMTYDISSLFNKEQDDVASALRSGLVGQTKPVRNFGMDITESSLQPILDNLGIDRTVRELSQAEKEIVRYLALLKQSSIAHGDMANTIESPSNQLRVLKNQLIECQRWFSALFINTFAKAMPYINAVVMVIKELCIWIGNLFGIEIKDYNSGIASFGDDFDDLSDSIDDATDSAKELKRQVLGFDQINNINESKDKSSDSGSGGIDQRLLDAITGYDNGMEKVRMKAIDIKNAILDWLGFLLDGDDIVGYSLPKGLKNIWNWYKKLNTLGKIFVGLGVATAIYKIVSAVKKLGVALGFSGLFKIVTSLLSPVSTLGGYLKVYTSLAGLEGYNNVKKLTAGLSEGINAWSKSLTVMDKMKNTLVGTGGLLVGWSLMNDAMKEFNETGEYSANVVLAGLGSALSNVTSGVMIGATYGGAYGAVVGGVAGVIITLTEALEGLETEEEKHQKLFDEKNKKLTEASNSYLEYNKAIDQNMNSLLSEQEINEEYVAELQNIVDENGNIKQGYEERAKFILGQLSSAYGVEYTIVDGQIQKYKELIDTINKTIEKKKAEILLDANKDKYANAIKNKTENWKNYQKALELVTEAESEYIRVSDIGYQSKNGILFNDDDIKKAKDNLDKANETLESSKKAWNETIDTIIGYENLWSASTSNNLDEIKKALEDYTAENSLSLAEEISLWKNYGDRIVETTGTVEESTYSMLDTVISNLKTQSQTIDSLTPEIVNAWGTLSEQSHDKFVENINTLPDDVKNELLGKMSDAGYDIGDDLNKGLDASKTEINDTSNQIGNSIADKTKDGARDKAGKSSFWQGFWTSLKNGLLTSLGGNNFLSVGANVFSGILSGMNNSNKASSFLSFGKNFISNLKSSLGIHSPSKLAMPIGVYTVLGIEEGMEDEIPNVKKEANSLIDTLQTTFDSGIGNLSLESAMTPNFNQNLSNISTYKSEINIDYSAIEQASYNGFAKAVQKYGLVQIDVKQDKGSIVETAIDGINKITRQTGENPIDLW